MTKSKTGTQRAARTRRIAGDIGTITSYVAAGGVAPGMQDLIDQIDFPQFVAALIEGVFNAAVHASIDQMDAYGKLVKDVARAIEQFSKDNATAEQAREWLMAKYPDLLDSNNGDDDDDHKKRRGARRARLTQKERRRLVARATLIGINRIVVTSGRIPTGKTTIRKRRGK